MDSILSGPRVLVTRTRQQASALAGHLARMGAQTILVPTIEVVAPSSFAKLDAALAGLAVSSDIFDWLIFTSANAVQAMAARAGEQGIVLRLERIAAIGPATAKAVALSGMGVRSEDILLPPIYVAESLAAALLENAAGPRHFLLVRAEEARDVLPAALEDAGHRVTIAPAYRNITPPDTLPALRRIFGSKEEWPRAITFTSSSTAKNLVELLDSIGQKIPAGTVLASIGPVTSATLRELGYEPTLEAEEPTIESLAATIGEHFDLC